MAVITLVDAQGARRIDAQTGENLYRVLTAHGVVLDAPCGGRCLCGKCKVHIAGLDSLPSAAESDLLTPDERARGLRLACAVRIEGDCTVTLPAAMQANILTDGAHSADYSVNAGVSGVCLKLAPPSLEDQRGDHERLLIACGNENLAAPPSILQKLPDALRAQGFEVSLTLDGDRLIDIRPGSLETPLYGLAIDIGTTTVVGYLMDLKDGTQLGVHSALSAQRAHGADVITRTDYTRNEPDGLKVLSDLIRGQINSMVAHFEREFDIQAQDIVRVTAAGNTIMMHLLAQLPVANIAVIPFAPVYTRAIDLLAGELDLRVNPLARVTLLPCVAGYVGADALAAVVASGMDERDEMSLMIDIGTNGEMALGHRGRMLACSTAAGPAFEGAHIRHGLGGVQGAISRVEMDEAGIRVRTIGDVPAIGICGSGLVDAIACLLEIEAIDMMGRLTTQEAKYPWVAARAAQIDGKEAFLLHSVAQGAQQDIYITQRDIREVQLAKGAIAAGLEILLKEMGAAWDQVRHVYLAGGFGNYIDYDSACRMTLLPAQVRDRIRPIGNAAGTGAKMALLDADVQRRLEKLRGSIEYLELSAYADFQDLFVDKMLFELE